MKAWKQFEADSGALFNAKRFWANSGERFDFEGPTAIGQCKLVKTMSLEALTQLAEEAAAEGNRKHKLGVVCAKVRRGRGVPSPMLVVMTADQFDQWFSMRNKGGDMKKPIPIQVSTGGLSRRVWAKDTTEAFRIFVDKYEPRSMGQLVQFTSKYLDDVYYAATEHLLREMGMFSGPGIGDVLRKEAQ